MHIHKYNANEDNHAKSRACLHDRQTDGRADGRTADSEQGWVGGWAGRKAGRVLRVVQDMSCKRLAVRFCLSTYAQMHTHTV